MTNFQVIEPGTVSSEPESIPVFNVRDLMVGGNLASIVLDNQTYTLRITRQNKLILTK
ncbi:MAG: hemin uptake protein HemP [Rhodobacteraceae bacterium]|nr:hemin uptake protein HemP [Paracoccaceae bacterium]